MQISLIFHNFLASRFACCTTAGFWMQQVWFGYVYRLRVCLAAPFSSQWCLHSCRLPTHCCVSYLCALCCNLFSLHSCKERFIWSSAAATCHLLPGGSTISNHSYLKKNPNQLTKKKQTDIKYNDLNDFLLFLRKLNFNIAQYLSKNLSGKCFQK